MRVLASKTPRGKTQNPPGRTLTEPIGFTIPVAPVTKKNSSTVVDVGPRCPVCRRGKSSRPLPSKGFARYQRDCGYPLGRLRGMNICSPVNVEAHYYIDADRTCDLTNLHAALHDMLVHYNVIADDNRKIIVSTDGSRVHVDRKNPRTEVIVTPVNLENGA